jgi:hypothetical protein
MTMTRWEYLYFTDAEKDASTLHPPTHKERLNELGRQGWELVGLVADQSGQVQKLYFKRPLGEK